MKYKVLYDNGFTFDNLKDAKAFAEQIFFWLGIVPAIVEA